MVIDGYTYRHSKMDAFTQFNVLRRISPVLGSLNDLLGGEAKVSALLGQIAMALSKMQDEEAAYIFNATLGLVQRQQNGESGWAPIWEPSVRRPMFEDIDLMTMLKITAWALQEVYAPFLSALGLNSQLARAG